MSSSSKHNRIATFLIVIYLVQTQTQTLEDSYLSELSNLCQTTQKPLHCLKFKLGSYITHHVSEPATNYTLGMVDFVHLNKTIPHTLYSELFGTEESRQLNGDTELDKMIKFGKRQINWFFSSYALKLPVPDEIQLVTEDVQVENHAEGRSFDDVEDNEIDGYTNTNATGLATSSRGLKRKKANMIFPIIVLLKLFKIKVLVVMILFGIMFIKKALLVAALLLPSLLNMIKLCKVHHPFHEHYQATDYSPDYGNGWFGTQGGYAAKEYGVPVYDRSAVVPPPSGNYKY